jgi:hypothetical protein
MRRSALVMASVVATVLTAFASRALSDDLPEYRLKAAFLYNFAVFTDWPAAVGPTLNVCVYGRDPFGSEIDPLQGKGVGDRRIALHRVMGVESLKDCQVVFVADSARGELPRVLASLHDAAVLTVADVPGAAAQGVILNMNVANNRVTFEVNLAAARGANLQLSSKLLRLATDVRQ